MKKVEGWWIKRLKRSDQHALNLNNVYVLPTRAGWMMGLTVAILMLATINYQLGLGYVLVFLLLGAGLIGFVQAYLRFTHLTLALDTATPLQAPSGEPLRIGVLILNRYNKASPRARVYLRGDENSSIECPALAAKKETRLELKAQTSVLGECQVAPIVIETRYPLGLIRLWSVWRLASTALVLPPVATDEGVRQHSAVPSLSSDAATMTDVRAYRTGDSPRNLLWKSVARRPDTPSAWSVRSVETDTEASQKIKHASSPQTPASIVPQAAWDKAFKRDEWLMLSLFTIALPFLWLIGWVYPLATLGLIAWRWFGLRQQAAMPPKWLQPVLIVALGVGIWSQFRTFNGIAAGVSACVGLLGIKALECPQTRPELNLQRDHWVLVFLGLFTLAAHFLVSQSLVSTTCVVLGLIALLRVLVMTFGNSVTLRASWLQTAKLVLWGTPIMAALFLLFPRFAPLWSMQQQQTTAKSGLSNTMQPGDIGQLSLDNRIVLRLKTSDGDKVDPAKLYLRGPVLTNFDGLRWTADTRREQALAPVRTEPVKVQVIKFQAVQEPSNQPWLFVPEFTTTKPLIEAHVSVQAKNNPPASTRATVDQQWLLRFANQTTALRYQFESTLSTAFASPQDAKQPSALQAALALPSGLNPRTSQYLQALQSSTHQSFTPQQWAAWVQGLFKAGMNGQGFTYTLEPGRYGTHGVDEFLFERRLGFCEHYAQAAVVMLRTVGIPARVVTGYQGAERSPLDEWLVVRNRNAHAWIEYFDGTYWHRLDPTASVAPARTITPQDFLNQTTPQTARMPSALAQWLSPLTTSMWRARAGFEATSFAWEEWLHNYNQGAQMSWLKRLGFDDPSWKDLVTLLDAALILCVLLGLGVYAFKRRTNADQWALLMQAARKRLAIALNQPVNTQATPLELSRAIPTEHPRLAQWQAWLLAMQQWRYDAQGADKTMTNKRLGTLRRDLQKIQRR